MYYPNVYGALPQMQERLMRMEQGYTAMPASLPVKSILVCKLIFLLDSYCHSLEKTF